MKCDKADEMILSIINSDLIYDLDKVTDRLLAHSKDPRFTDAEVKKILLQLADVRKIIELNNLDLIAHEWMAAIEEYLRPIPLADIEFQHSILHNIVDTSSGYICLYIEPATNTTGQYLERDHPELFHEAMHNPSQAVVMGSLSSMYEHPLWDSFLREGSRSPYLGAACFMTREDIKQSSGYQAAAWSPRKNQCFWAGAMAAGKDFQLITPLFQYGPTLKKLTGEKGLITGTDAEIGWLLDNGYQFEYTEGGMGIFRSPGQKRPEALYLRSYSDFDDCMRLHAQIVLIKESMSMQPNEAEIMSMLPTVKNEFAEKGRTAKHRP